MLYFNQSIYIHSHIETPHGVARLGGGGIWQFRPETMELDVFIRGLVNPWGHHFDRWGQSFATDGAGGEGINYVLPGAYYATAPDAVRILHGLNPGSPKYCGLEVASGRHLPEAWRGNLLTNDFRGNRVCRFVVSDDGAGFSLARAARADQDAAPGLPARSTSRWGRTARSTSPTGTTRSSSTARSTSATRAATTPTAGSGVSPPRAGRWSSGRSWSSADVRTCSKPSRPPRTGPGTTPSACSRNAAARSSPRWPPGSRGSTRTIPSRSTSGSKRSGPTNRSTWSSPTCSALLCLGRPARPRGGRRGSSQHWQDRLETRWRCWRARVIDEHPRVRLEAVRVARAYPRGASAELALRALDRPVDKFLDYALWLTARELAALWLPARRVGPVRRRRQRASAGLRAGGGRLARGGEAAGRGAASGQARGRAQGGPLLPDRHARRPGRAGAGPRPGLADATAPSERASLLDALAQAVPPAAGQAQGRPDALVALLDAKDDA